VIPASAQIAYTFSLNGLEQFVAVRLPAARWLALPDNGALFTFSDPEED
jgi:hypothetical protein